MLSPQGSQLVTQIGQLASDGLVLTLRLSGPCAA
jgi:hypothetical protein